METTLDKLGRIVIPRQVREDLGLRPGIRLQIEECQEEIRLKPIYGEDKVVLKDNVLVFTGNTVGDIIKALEEQRRERSKRVLSKSVS